MAIAPLLALSIRQPYVEQIFRGSKRIEYRTRATRIRGKIYLYASLKPGDPDVYRGMQLKVGDVPTGRIVGTAMLVDCTKSRRYRGHWEWHLRQARRLSRPFKPTKQPQPVWFYPR